MYYSSGNYEAFARPRKPEGVDNKSAHIIGTYPELLIIPKSLDSSWEIK